MEQKPESNVLVIDDSGTIRQGIKMVLQQAKLFDRILDAASAEEGLEIVRNERMELILCDIVMPGMDGYQFLSTVKGLVEYRDIPVILLTGRDSVESKVRGLDLGASDYVTKPFEADELIARVRVQIKVKRLQDELKIAKQRYKEMSITDFLTGIYNRRHFMELFTLEFSRSRRYDFQLSLMIFDIDNFKSINDTYGHSTGDEVLRVLSQMIREEIRQHDVFARYGGEEFVLMLPQTSASGALSVAEKLRQKVAGHGFESMEGRAITISIGVATYPAPEFETSEKLINAADNALYVAKRSGKNKVVFADPSHDKQD